MKKHTLEILNDWKRGLKRRGIIKVTSYKNGVEVKPKQ